MAYECFKFSVKNHIATVTYDRPPVNAQNRRARDEAIDIFEKTETDVLPVLDSVQNGHTLRLRRSLRCTRCWVVQVTWAAISGVCSRASRVKNRLNGALLRCSTPTRMKSPGIYARL